MTTVHVSRQDQHPHEDRGPLSDHVSNGPTHNPEVVFYAGPGLATNVVAVLRIGQEITLKGKPPAMPGLAPVYTGVDSSGNLRESSLCEPLGASQERKAPDEQHGKGILPVRVFGREVFLFRRLAEMKRPFENTSRSRKKKIAGWIN